MDVQPDEEDNDAEVVDARGLVLEMGPTVQADQVGRHNVMTIATLRRNGYPQATTVTYANDGLDIYFGCDRTAQKITNIKHDSKVSLTIDRDYRNWSQIKGLSMAANAYILADSDEIEHAARLLAKKFAQWAQLSPADKKAVRFVKVVPKIISILDYTKGFGHTDLVRA